MSGYQPSIERQDSGQHRVDVVELVKLGEVLGFDPTEIVDRLAKMQG